MSAPIRVQIEADETTQDQFGVIPPENEPGDETHIAVPVRAEAPTPIDSDVTIETPRLFPDELGSPHSEVAPETGQENGHASAVPLVARTLKNPPEIWDLVHETPVQFNPGGAFVARLTSSKTKLILLALAVICISGLGAYAVITLRDGRNRAAAAPQVLEERDTSQTVPASQESAPVTAPESALNAPVNGQSNTSPGAGDAVANTPPQSTAPQATDLQATGPQPDNAASAENSFTNSIQPTGVSVSNVSKRTPSLRTGAAEWGSKNATVAAGRQRTYESRLGPDTTGKRQTSEAQTADLKRSNEKSSLDSASAKKRSDTTVTPQVIAPPPATSTAPKAKVIQWP
jgi:hypothetical protein